MTTHPIDAFVTIAAATLLFALIALLFVAIGGGAP